MNLPIETKYNFENHSVLLEMSVTERAIKELSEKINLDVLDRVAKSHGYFQPETCRNIGHGNFIFECSECSFKFYGGDILLYEFKFCPECGRKVED